MEFRLNIEREGNIRILQITDMQLIDANQRRYPDRISGWKLTEWIPEKNEKNIYSHIKYLVNETSPDLIIITGDIIYGEFDDKGSSFCEFCDFMDSLGIPWAPVFGNHDNESNMGIAWQCEMLEKAKYSLFDRGSVSGNSNYAVEIYRNGQHLRTLYMLDSNGCGKIGIPEGICDDQLEWMCMDAVLHPDVPSFVCFHIPTRDFSDAYIAAGYQAEHDDNKNPIFFEIGKTVPARSGEFGKKLECLATNCKSILPYLKRCRADGVFAGHYHITNTSVMYEGIRFTLGLKTGLYDYYDEESLGGTLITLCGGNFSVEHIRVPEQMREPFRD